MTDAPLPDRFETSRLTLRRPVMADAEGMFAAYAADPEVTRYLQWRPHVSVATVREVVAQYLERRASGEGEQAFVIAEKGRPEQPLGVIGITIAGHEAEVGYVIARAFWGRGYMTEALECLSAWALSQPAICRFSAVCDVENMASVRVLEKAGLVREGCLRRHTVFPNVSDAPRDCFIYAKVRGSDE